MVNREEICGALSYLIQTLQKCTGSDQEVEIDGDTISVGLVIQHSKMLLSKLIRENREIGDGGQIVMTQNAYKELMKEIGEANRVAAGAEAKEE